MLKLKVALFITSFFPLWVSIFFINFWSVITFVLPKLKNRISLEMITWNNFLELFCEKWLEISFSILILFLFIYSAIILLKGIVKVPITLMDK